MILYRKIEKKDNEQICNIIRTALKEYDGDRQGTAYYDNDTEQMFEAYQGEKEVYFVAELEGKLVGGCGIKHLADTDANIAELQKLYLLKESRGLGIGKKLLEKCMKFSYKAGFEYVYLETFPEMTAAQNLYKQNGFEYLQTPMGGTGHSGCDIWMLKKIK